MATVELAQGQAVSIPALKLTNGHPMQGIVRLCDGEKLLIELPPDLTGNIPELARAEKFYINWNNDGMARTCPVVVARHSERLLIAQVSLSERREAPRLSIDMKMHYRVISEDQISAEAEEVFSMMQNLEGRRSEASMLMDGESDPIEILKDEITQMRQAIFDLTRKIDYLTDIAEGHPPVRVEGTEYPIMMLNCSNTGVGFLGKHPHPQGTYLRMHMELPTVPVIQIDCLGVVVRCLPVHDDDEESGNQPAVEKYDFGVQFTHIHEQDREQIIQHLFRMQRRFLRDRKEARDRLSRVGDAAGESIQSTKK